MYLYLTLKTYRICGWISEIVLLTLKENKIYWGTVNGDRLQRALLAQGPKCKLWPGYFGPLTVALLLPLTMLNGHLSFWSEEQPPRTGYDTFILYSFRNAVFFLNLAFLSLFMKICSFGSQYCGTEGYKPWSATLISLFYFWKKKNLEHLVSC